MRVLRQKQLTWGSGGIQAEIDTRGPTRKARVVPRRGGRPFAAREQPTVGGASNRRPGLAAYAKLPPIETKAVILPSCMALIVSTKCRPRAGGGSNAGQATVRAEL